MKIDFAYFKIFYIGILYLLYVYIFFKFLVSKKIIFYQYIQTNDNVFGQQKIKITHSFPIFSSVVRETSSLSNFSVRRSKL